MLKKLRERMKRLSSGINWKLFLLYLLKWVIAGLTPLAVYLFLKDEVWHPSIDFLTSTLLEQQVTILKIHLLVASLLLCIYHILVTKLQDMFIGVRGEDSFLNIIFIGVITAASILLSQFPIVISIVSSLLK